ncbi:MAG: hypothetical protein Q9195_004694 [Heterodermia aff. obscurata]
MDLAARTFFASPLFAVAGASQSPHKFGHKLLAWYHSRSLPVQPITPSTPTITIASTEYTTIASPRELPHPTQTSLSIVTPPKVTIGVLREAKEAGVPAVWLQPGSFDEEGSVRVLNLLDTLSLPKYKIIQNQTQKIDKTLPETKLSPKPR